MVGSHSLIIIGIAVLFNAVLYFTFGWGFWARLIPSCLFCVGLANLLWR